MNTSVEYKQKQRVMKNQNKGRHHTRRVESASMILHGVNEMNKKERKKMKRFKVDGVNERVVVWDEEYGNVSEEENE